MSGSAVEPDLFRRSMRQLAGAVSVVTAGTGNDRAGFTATSVSSLSADPPTVLVSLNRGSSSWPAFEKTGVFCVNILAVEQQAVARSFAGYDGRKGIERYRDAEWMETPSGAPALKQALCTIDCALDEAIHRHSHAILIGRVLDVAIGADAEPLLYWNGAFRELKPL